MKFWEAFRVAGRALYGNTLRSILTMLGIIIGVASVITTVAVSEGAQLQVLEQLEMMGSNLIMIKSGEARRSATKLQAGTLQTLTEGDAKAIRAEVAGVRMAVPLVLGPTQIVRQSKNWNTWVRGTEPDFFVAREWKTARGQQFSEEDVLSGAKVAVLGKTVADALFGNENPIGGIIRIAKAPFTVMGVLESKGSTADGRNEDDAIFVPITTAKSRLFSEKHRLNRESVAYVLVKVIDSDFLSPAESQIQKLLRQRHQIAQEMEDDFKINNWAATMAARLETARTLSLLLGILASVSLIVGGISIMNIMLVSVTERTREIGLRLAVGARPRDIRIQFLIEAVALCFLGGAIGVAFGVTAAIVFGQLAGWTVLIGPDAIGLALGFAVAVGVIFGYYPARRASRLNPIAALHIN